MVAVVQCDEEGDLMPAASAHYDVFSARGLYTGLSDGWTYLNAHAVPQISERVTSGVARSFRMATAVALLDILQAQLEPQLTLLCTPHKVCESSFEGHGLGRWDSLAFWLGGHAGDISAQLIVILHAQHPSARAGQTGTTRR